MRNCAELVETSRRPMRRCVPLVILSNTAAVEMGSSSVSLASVSGEKQWRFLADGREARQARIDGNCLDRGVLECDVRLRAQDRTRRARLELLLARRERDSGSKTAQD